MYTVLCVFIEVEINSIRASLELSGVDQTTNQGYGQQWFSRMLSETAMIKLGLNACCRYSVLINGSLPWTYVKWYILRVVDQGVSVSQKDIKFVL